MPREDSLESAISLAMSLDTDGRKTVAAALQLVSRAAAAVAGEMPEGSPSAAGMAMLSIVSLKAAGDLMRAKPNITVELGG